MQVSRRDGVAEVLPAVSDAGAGEGIWRSCVGMIGARTRWGGTRFLQWARWSRHDRGEDQMAGPNAHGAPLTRVELREELDRFREELDRFRDEMHRELRHYATKADVANLKSWMVGLLLVVMLNVLGTVGAIVAAVLTG